jgi:hypothetical protein
MAVGVRKSNGVPVTGVWVAPVGISVESTGVYSAASIVKQVIENRSASATVKNSSTSAARR